MLLLGILSGAVLASGAFVAPVIFHANEYLPTPLLDRLTSGILMTQIFINLNTLMSITALFSLAFELYYFLKIKRSYASLFFSFVMFVSVALFVFYCTPFIIEAQKMGAEAIKSTQFESVHKLSEMLFKLILVCSLALQGIRFYFYKNSYPHGHPPSHTPA